MAGQSGQPPQKKFKDHNEKPPTKHNLVIPQELGRYVPPGIDHKKVNARTPIRRSDSESPEKDNPLDDSVVPGFDDQVNQAPTLPTMPGNQINDGGNGESPSGNVGTKGNSTDGGKVKKKKKPGKKKKKMENKSCSPRYDALRVLGEWPLACPWQGVMEFLARNWSELENGPCCCSNLLFLADCANYYCILVTRGRMQYWIEVQNK